MNRNRKRSSKLLLSKLSKRHLRRLRNNIIDIDIPLTEPLTEVYESNSVNNSNKSCRPSLILSSSSSSRENLTIHSSSSRQTFRDCDMLLNNLQTSSNCGYSSRSSSLSPGRSPINVLNISPNNSNDLNIKHKSNSDSDISYNFNQSEEYFQNVLSAWAIQFNIAHNALSGLLEILRKHIPLSILPKDPRTLLKTPRNTNIVQMGSGEYFHYGLLNVCKLIVDSFVLSNINLSKIDLQINIDGLPISRSSNASLWPILCSDIVTDKVYLVGAYFGSSKPKDSNEFLQKFVDDAINIIDNGFEYNNKNFQVNISALICDCPAKSFVLSTKGHTGYYSCSKCTIKGKHIFNKMCFPMECNENTVLRTDLNFKQYMYEDYQTRRTVFNDIPNFGCVTNVPLDYLHLVLLGVVKQIIKLWTSAGPLKVRISNNIVNVISDGLLRCRKTVPNDFVRKPRPLSDFKHWKGVEFKQFLLFTGPLVLKDNIDESIYNHFLCLSISIRILSHPELVKHSLYLNYANDLLTIFVKEFEILYGPEYMHHNIHNLLHLTIDVRRYGPIDNFSAFRFENHMMKIKKMIRKNDKPLQQIAKRFSEIESHALINGKKYCEISLNKEHKLGPIPNSNIFNGQNILQYNQIVYKNKISIICNNFKDNCILIKNGIFISVLNIIQINKKNIYIIGSKLKPIGSLFKKPCDSKDCMIQIVEQKSKICFWPIEEIQMKLWIMKYNNDDFNNYRVVYPINHTYINID